MHAALHPNEPARLASLRYHAILDTPAELRYNRLVFMAAQIFRVPISLVTFIDEDRQWFKAAIGTAVHSCPRDIAFCASTILQSDILIVEDAREDPRFSANPLVTGDPFIRFYAGIALRSSDDLPLGTLCVVDRQPRRVSSEQEFSLRALAREGEILLRSGVPLVA